MRQKKRQMWVHDDFYNSVKRKCETQEKSMIDFTKSLTDDMEEGKYVKKKRNKY